MADGEQRDAAGLTAEERVEGERLVADMTPGEWWNESRVIHAPLGDHRASHPVSTQTDEDADAICWLRNHAAQLLVDSAELSRERRRVAAQGEMLRQIRRMALFGEEGYDTPETLSHIVALIDADAPGPGGDGEGR